MWIHINGIHTYGSVMGYFLAYFKSPNHCSFPKHGETRPPGWWCYSPTPWPWECRQITWLWSKPPRCRRWVTATPRSFVIFEEIFFVEIFLWRLMRGVIENHNDKWLITCDSRSYSHDCNDYIQIRTNYFHVQTRLLVFGRKGRMTIFQLLLVPYPQQRWPWKTQRVR